MKLIQNLLVLITVIGFALTGWLAGHILRFSMPASQFQHPPIEQIDPKIENGFDFEFEGIRRVAVFSKMQQTPQMQIYFDKQQINLLDECVGNTYYTSLPAKCRFADGRLVQVGGIQLGIIIAPMEK